MAALSHYLDLNLVEDLAVVDANNGPDHLRNDDHVTEMSLDAGRLLVREGGELGLTQTLDEGKRLALQATVETSASTAGDHLDELETSHEYRL